MGASRAPLREADWCPGLTGRFPFPASDTGDPPGRASSQLALRTAAASIAGYYSRQAVDFLKTFFQKLVAVAGATPLDFEVSYQRSNT